MIRMLGLTALLALALAACEAKESKEARKQGAVSTGYAVLPLPPPPVVPGDGPLALTRLDFAQLPGWSDDDPAGAVKAFHLSCARMAKRASAATLGPEGRYGRVIDWWPACAALGEPDAYDQLAARTFFETWFQPYLVSAEGKSEGLFTGYYETEVEGAFQRGGDYQWPLYRKPSDLGDGPYHDRGAIEDGALAGRGLELVWLNDPVDAFDLHIQGSGVVSFPDGSKRRIGFAASNARPFVGIGRLMLDRGHIGPSEASAQGVRAWLEANPEAGRELMRENPRYIFFRWIEGETGGPIGAQGVPLTPGRSLAVDPSYLAYGVPLFLESSYSTGQPLRRLMIAQDTGGAIKGPVRGDLYWGTGAAALEIAGGMKQKGRYYLFLPRTLTVAAK